MNYNLFFPGLILGAAAGIALVIAANEPLSRLMISIAKAVYLRLDFHPVNELQDIVDNQGKILEILQNEIDRRKGFMDDMESVFSEIVEIDELADDEEERRELLRRYFNIDASVADF